MGSAAKVRSIAQLTGIAAMLVLISLPASPAIADDLSVLFHGKWTGNGTMRPKVFNALEKTRCKVAGAKTSSGKTRFSGRCATVSGSGAFKMEIHKVPGTERYEAEVQLPNVVQPVRLRGVARGRTLTFTLVKPFKQDGRTITTSISTSFPDDDTMIMSETATDAATGEKSDAIAMEFKRRG
jgi:hypothetical protein